MLPQSCPVMIFLKTPFFLNYTNFSFWKDIDIQPNIPYILLCECVERLVDLQLLITLTYLFSHILVQFCHWGADIEIFFATTLIPCTLSTRP